MAFNMTKIDEEAEKLNNQLKEFSWINGIGVSDSEIIVYSSKKKIPEKERCIIPKKIDNYSVRIQYIGNIKLL